MRDILAHRNIPCGAWQTDGTEESSRDLRSLAASLQPDPVTEAYKDMAVHRVARVPRPEDEAVACRDLVS